MTTQPEALRLAYLLDATELWPSGSDRCQQAAAELRHLHEVNAELVDALKESLWRMEQYNYEGMQNTIARTKAAIAKATGEQQ